ncbi:MAG: M67 family metallopeptidase [Nitrososphaerota archaeon]|nr:M67 family metallopeptidase [Nitrososphaerota archaeon]
MQHSEEGYPEEVCGVMLSPSDTSDLVISLRRMKNSHDGPRQSRYSIDPMELYAADNEATKEGMLIVGIYHSHPDSPAKPSKFDLDHSFPWYKYVITSVVEGKVKDTRCWAMNNDRTAFMEEAIVEVEIRK